WLRQYIAEMRFKPMPFFSEGAVVHPGKPDPKGVVGKVFIQPTVRQADGSPVRLDDAIGLRFAVVAWSAQVDPWIDDESRQLLEQLDARSVVLRPVCQAADRNPPRDGMVLGDIDGSCKRWFDDITGSVIILRPDRIVAAACQPWQLNDVLRQLSRRMHINTIEARS